MGVKCIYQGKIAVIALPSPRNGCLHATPSDATTAHPSRRALHRFLVPVVQHNALKSLRALTLTDHVTCM